MKLNKDDYVIVQSPGWCLLSKIVSERQPVTGLKSPSWLYHDEFYYEKEDIEEIMVWTEKEGNEVKKSLMKEWGFDTSLSDSDNPGVYVLKKFPTIEPDAIPSLRPT